MNTLVLRAGRRFHLHRPWQLFLALTGIALGVAVFVGIDLASDGAQRAFESSTALVRGRTTHRLLAVGDRMSDATFAALARRGVTAAPVVELTARFGGESGLGARVIGVDPIEEAALRDFTSLARSGGDALLELMLRPDSVLLPAALAERHGLGTGDRIDLLIDGQRVEASIVGLQIESGEPSGAPIVTDISTAQRWADRAGLDRIDLRLTEEQADVLGADPPAGTTLVAAGSENAALDQMMRAFRTNLLALGLLALAVGMFLIYSTMSFAIVQRRPTIGMLRALGIGRTELLLAFMVEATVLGILGTLAGLALGHWLSTAMMSMVLQTVGDLSFSRVVTAGPARPTIYLQGAMLGLCATWVAALAPALEAAMDRTDDALGRAALEARSRTRVHSAACAAVPTLLAAALLLWVAPDGLTIAFVALALVLGAGALLTPFVLVTLMRGLEPALSAAFGPAGLLAVRGVRGSLSRTAVAGAALAVAVATVIGIGIMIASFRTSLEAWLDTTLTADLYVALGDGGAIIDDARLDTLISIPGVEGLSRSRGATLPGADGPLGLRAATPGPEGWGLELVAGDLARLDAGQDVVAVAEPFAYRTALGVGDSLTLPTLDGPHRFDIAAVFRDYNASGDPLLMPLTTYRRHWRDDRVTGLGVHLAGGADERAVRDRLEATLGLEQPLAIRSTRTILNATMTIFDRTFEITEVLRWLAGLIAFVGVLSAALAIQLERGREVAVLRSLGFTPRETGLQSLAQTTLLGLGAGVAAVPIGIALAAMLVHVINRRSFGWTMELELAFTPAVLGVVLAVGAAALAGLYPAWRAARLPLDTALRDE